MIPKPSNQIKRPQVGSLQPKEFKGIRHSSSVANNVGLSKLPIRNSGFHHSYKQIPQMPFSKISSVSSLAQFPKISQVPVHIPKVPTMTPKNIDCQIYTVKILDNHGDPENLLISSIILLDDKRIPIEIQKITSVPIIEKSELDKLIDRMLVKHPSDEFHIKFKPGENFTPVSIIFYVSSETQPKFIRIWNTRNIPEASARHIIITNGKYICYDGEIPKGFGNDISLQPKDISKVRCSNSLEILHDLFPELAAKARIFDRYGGIYIAETKSMRIEVMNTWAGTKEENIGLNGIDIYDHDYRIIEWDDIEDVRMEGCKNFIGIQNLFRADKVSVDYSEMFMAEVRNWFINKPVINIIFKVPTRISRVNIWNFNAEKRSLKFGFKNINIRYDGKLIFTGKINMGTGLARNARYNICSLWFTDIPLYRDKELTE